MRGRLGPGRRPAAGTRPRWFLALPFTSNTAPSVFSARQPAGAQSPNHGVLRHTQHPDIIPRALLHIMPHMLMRREGPRSECVSFGSLMSTFRVQPGHPSPSDVTRFQSRKFVLGQPRQDWCNGSWDPAPYSLHECFRSKRKVHERAQTARDCRGSSSGRIRFDATSTQQHNVSGTWGVPTTTEDVREIQSTAWQDDPVAPACMPFRYSTHEKDFIPREPQPNTRRWGQVTTSSTDSRAPRPSSACAALSDDGLRGGPGVHHKALVVSPRSPKPPGFRVSSLIPSAPVASCNSTSSSNLGTHQQTTHRPGAWGAHQRPGSCNQRPGTWRADQRAGNWIEHC